MMPSFNEEINIKVGNNEETSTVKINNHKICTAESGMNGEEYYGGDGYSGGGTGTGSGGSDGEDGQGSGGHGTGEDVTNNQFFAFELSPGQGANGSNGGGGVLVNGQGPYVGYNGQGYGGGGSGYSHINNHDGSSGVVLIEVFN